jgi:hypothetical protein
MRSLLLAVAVACGILAVCLTDPSGAQQLQKFNPRVCNQSGSEAQFAVIVRTAAKWSAIVAQARRLMCIT